MLIKLNLKLFFEINKLIIQNLHNPKNPKYCRVNIFIGYKFMIRFPFIILKHFSQ